MNEEMYEIIIDRGHFFVIGDNTGYNRGTDICDKVCLFLKKYVWYHDVLLTIRIHMGANSKFKIQNPFTYIRECYTKYKCRNTFPSSSQQSLELSLLIHRSFCTSGRVGVHECVSMCARTSVHACILVMLVHSRYACVNRNCQILLLAHHIPPESN